MQPIVELIGLVALIGLFIYAAASGTLATDPRFVRHVHAMIVFTIPFMACFMLYEAYKGTLDAEAFYVYTAVAVGFTLAGLGLYAIALRKK